PILIFPDFNNPFELFCDASATHVGAVLVQRINGVAHPVAFASRQLTKQERNSSAGAIRDHKPLSTLVKAKEPNGRLNRLMLKLQDFDTEILYYPVKLNFTADQLSRPPTETSNVEVKTLEYQANIDWEKEQENDKEIALVRSDVRANLKDEDYECLNLKEFWKKVREKLIVKNGILYKTSDSESLIVIPSKLVRLICKLNHDAITPGHLSYDRTLQSFANKYVWPEMRANVFDYCSSCDIVDKPWDLGGIDCAGPLKRTKSGKIHFVIAVDYFSKYCIAEATIDTTGETTAI
ncbi:unnamed protein product, partial [Brachionus calyciflorus]